MGQGQAEVDEGSNLLHTHLFALGKDGRDGGVQDDGNVAEDGDAHDEASQGRGQLEALALELLDEEVDHAGGSARMRRQIHDDPELLSRIADLVRAAAEEEAKRDEDG